MRDIGVVTELSGNFAYVSVNTSSCKGGCSSCKGCKQAVRAENSIGAKCGDRVLVERSSRAVVLLPFAIFIVPILLYVAVFLLSSSHGFSIFATALYVLLLVLLSKRFSFDGKITEICR